MLSRNHNLIQDEQKGDHSINKYEFKAIVPLEIQTNTDSTENTTDEQNVEQVNAYRPPTMNSLEKELIEKLLHKSDELSGNLAEREKIVQSLITLENTLKQSQIHLEALEKELSSIAIDMAKEVIVKEIEENSQRVALELTRSLLSNIMEATQIGIKVNPIDYVYLKENLKDKEKIQIEADNAISRGGVVISSNLGNLDGNVMSRYKMLKQSVLDNLND